jgi:hypothetical protein
MFHIFLLSAIEVMGFASYRAQEFEIHVKDFVVHLVVDVRIDDKLFHFVVIEEDRSVMVSVRTLGRT